MKCAESHLDSYNKPFLLIFYYLWLKIAQIFPKSNGVDLDSWSSTSSKTTAINPWPGKVAQLDQGRNLFPPCPRPREGEGIVYLKIQTFV